MPNSGYVDYVDLEEYYLDNSVVTGNTTSNSPSDPNYIPPYYDPIQCPAVFIPSPSPTPSITPSTSPQGKFGKYRVNIYASLQSVSIINEEVNVYYKIDNGNWNFFGTVGGQQVKEGTNTACVNLGTISVYGGSTLYTAMMTGSDASLRLPDNADGTKNDLDTSFYALNKPNCKIEYKPEYCGTSIPYSLYVIQDEDVSMVASIYKEYLKPCETGLVHIAAESTTPVKTMGRLAPTPSSSPGAYFTGNINIASTSADVCANNWDVTTIDAVGNESVYCNSTQFSSNYFSTVPAGNYYIEKDGYVISITTDESYIAIVNSNSCVLCPSIPVTPSPTLTPTPSVSVGTVPSITSFGASLFSCFYDNDYVGFYATLDAPSPYDMLIQLSIDMYDEKGFQFTTVSNVTINAGDLTNTIGSNPCLNGGIPTNGYYPYSTCILNISSGSTEIVNPFGYCSGPASTPSVTPSITPSITPTVTPTISVTPTITNTPTPTATSTPTPTVTPSPTPSSTAEVNFTVTMNNEGLFKISNITALESIVFYDIKTGSLPLSNGDTLTGYLNNSVSTPIRINVTNYAGQNSISLYVNGIMQQCLSVYQNGNYTFTAVDIKQTDTVEIKAEKAC